MQNLLDGLLREHGTNGYSWASRVRYQGIDEEPIFSEKEYDKDPMLGYVLKRKGLYENQESLGFAITKIASTTNL